MGGVCAACMCGVCVGVVVFACALVVLRNTMFVTYVKVDTRAIQDNG